MTGRSSATTDLTVVRLLQTVSAFTKPTARDRGELLNVMCTSLLTLPHSCRGYAVSRRARAAMADVESSPVHLLLFQGRGWVRRGVYVIWVRSASPERHRRRILGPTSDGSAAVTCMGH